jgi:hypothetical protein
MIIGLPTGGQSMAVGWLPEPALPGAPQNRDAHLRCRRRLTAASILVEWRCGKSEHQCRRQVPSSRGTGGDHTRHSKEREEDAREAPVRRTPAPDRSDFGSAPESCVLWLLSSLKRSVWCEGAGSTSDGGVTRPAEPTYQRQARCQAPVPALLAIRRGPPVSDPWRSPRDGEEAMPELPTARVTSMLAAVEVEALRLPRAP